MKHVADFGILKARIGMKDLLEHYGLLDHMKARGAQLSGRCPFHEDAKPSLSVNLDKNAWHCFACGKKGNILDFAKEKEGLGSIREAALWLTHTFETGDDKAPRGKRRPLVEEGRTVQRHDGVPSDGQGVNPPLTFTLQNLDPAHPYLKSRLGRAAVDHFGLGFCSRGSMAGRVVVPIHNEEGELVAYAGRWPDDGSASEEGKYRLPPGFVKSAVLFNLNRQEGSTDHLIVVEGFFSVFRLWEAGFKNAVALMGSSMSDRQEELLLRQVGSSGRVSVFLDDDEAGRAGSREVVARLLGRTFVKQVLYSVGSQPDELSNDQLREMLS